MVEPMRVFTTKLPDKDAEKFIEACRKIGKSTYEVIRELIYKWLREQGYEANNEPVEVRLQMMEQCCFELEQRVARLEKALTDLQQRLEKQNLGQWFQQRKKR